MTLCVINGKQCQCQPDEGVPCAAGTPAQVQAALWKRKRIECADSVAAERERLEPVGWQQRYLCPNEGPGIWVFCATDRDAEILQETDSHEVRRVFALVA